MPAIGCITTGSRGFFPGCAASSACSAPGAGEEGRRRVRGRSPKTEDAEGHCLMRISRPLSLRADEFNYTLQILLAVLVGALAALGNLGFRALIEFFTRIFLGLEWRALEIA